MTSVQVINERAAHRRLRRAVFARDAGVCARCRRDCEALRKRLCALSPEARRLERRRLGIARDRTSLWDIHHVTPRAEGGGDALTNLATLCLWCHERETTLYAGERASERRAAMGIDWLPMRSLNQAVPPAYTEFIGRAFLASAVTA